MSVQISVKQKNRASRYQCNTPFTQMCNIRAFNVYVGNMETLLCLLFPICLLLALLDLLDGTKDASLPMAS